MKYFILLALFSLPAFADPFRIVIITDQGGTDRSQAFSRYLRRQVPPFNRMLDADLQIEVRTLSPENNQMNCQKDPAIDRVVTCDQNFLQAQAGNAMAVAITSAVTDYGGSGGQVPVATTGLPLQMLVHEMLHTAGMADEYAYRTPAEISYYCGTAPVGPNAAYFAARASYANDPEARSVHRPDVAWMGRILPATLVTSGSALGTPAAAAAPDQQRIGLYRGGPCPRDPATGKESWRPYPNSIMLNPEQTSVYPLYEQAFVDYIQPRLGRELQLKRRNATDATRLAALEIEVNDPDVVILPEEAPAAGVSDQ